MVGSAIRHLATATNSPTVAAAFFQRTVQLWNLQTGEQYAQLDTVLDFGGRRLSLSQSGEFLVAGSWTNGKRGGVACYDTDSGRTIWHRTDIRHVQHLCFSPSGQTVWCGLNTEPLLCLNATTGTTVEARSRTCAITASPFSAHQLLEAPDDTLIIAGTKDIRIRRSTFALLDTAFGPDALCLSEAAGPVRCLDCSTGDERWRYQPEADRHVLTLTYRCLDGHYYGVEFEYRRGKSRHLVRLDGQTGRCEHIRDLTSWDEKFGMLGERLVTSSGDVIDVGTGSIITRLGFPQIEYPDQS